jgi:hypothetical protein
MRLLRNLAAGGSAYRSFCMCAPAVHKWCTGLRHVRSVWPPSPAIMKALAGHLYISAKSIGLLVD